MVTDKPLRPRSCAGPIRAGVRRRDISRHYSILALLWPSNIDDDSRPVTVAPHA